MANLYLRGWESRHYASTLPINCYETKKYFFSLLLFKVQARKIENFASFVPNVLNLEAYSEPFQTSKIERFAIFAKRFFSDVWQGSEYASASCKLIIKNSSSR